MIKLDNCETEKTPETGDPDIELFLDTQILRMLGLRFEIAHGLLKLWPADVDVPDETNWQAGVRFTQSASECMRLIEHFGCQASFGEENGWHWAICHLGEDAEFESDEFESRDVAAAAILYMLLVGMKGITKSVET